MAEFLFSYGTLQKQETQLRIFGRLLTGFPDVLRGYRNQAVEITDPYFLGRGEEKTQQTAVQTNNHRDMIRGTAFELSLEELLKADEYEPVGYKRFKVKLESGTEAWLYRTVDPRSL